MGKKTIKLQKILLMFMTMAVVLGISIAAEHKTAYAFGGNWNINGYSSENHCQIQMTKASNGDLYITGYSFYTYVQQYNQKSIYNSSTGWYSAGDHYYELIFNGKTYYDRLAPSSSLNMTSMANDAGMGRTNGNIAVGTQLNLNYNQVSFQFVIPFSDIAGINPMASNDLSFKLRNVLTNVRYNSASAAPRTISYSNPKLATVKYNNGASVTYTINSSNAGSLSSWKGYNYTISFASETIQNVYVNAEAVLARTTPDGRTSDVNWNYNRGYLTRRGVFTDRKITYNVENTSLTQQSGGGGFVTATPLKISYNTTSTATRNATESEIKSNPRYINANNEYHQAKAAYTTAFSAYQAYVSAKPTDPSQTMAYLQSSKVLSRKVDAAYANMNAKYNYLQNVIADISTTSTTISNRQNGILYASSIYLEGFGNDYGIRADLSGISYNIKVVYRRRKEESSSWVPSEPLWIAPSSANSIDVNPYWCSPGGPYYGYRIKSISPSGNSTINFSGVRTSYDGTANFSAYSAGSTVYVDIVFANDKPVVTAQDNSIGMNNKVDDDTIREKLLTTVTDKEDGTIEIKDPRIKYTIKNSKGQTVTVDKIDTSREAAYIVEFSYTDKGGKTGTGTAKLEVTDPNAHLTIQYNIHIQDVNSVTYSNLYREDKTAYFTKQKSVTKGTSFTFSDANMLEINKDLYNRIGLTGYCLDKVVVKRNDTNSYKEFKNNNTKAEYDISGGVSFTGIYNKTNTVIYVDVYYKDIKSNMNAGK